MKILKIILFIAALSIFPYVFGDDLSRVWSQIYARYFPCRQPIYYNIASFDTRFGISEKYFLENIKRAEAIWESPVNKELFSYANDGNLNNSLKINLVYDYRQEATAKLKTLGLVVSETRASYDAIRAKYETLQADYLKNKKEYQTQVSAFQNRQNEYTKKVDYWNKKGGAPRDVYEELSAEAQSLKVEFERIKKLEASLNAQISNLNALVTVINDLARTLNLSVGKLNTIGESRGEEFTQGEYKSGPLGQEIDIYEFSTEAKLVRVLAHELGHALGLEHVEDPLAIMYYLNENKNGKLTKDDLGALKSRCGIK